MAKWDLTKNFVPYLDTHLILPLLEFLSENQIYDDDEIQKARLPHLLKTKMVDFFVEVYLKLHPDEDIEGLFKVEHDKWKKQVFNDINQINAQAIILKKVLEDLEKDREIQIRRDGRQLLQYLVENHNIRPDITDLLYLGAKKLYDCGDYTRTSAHLYYWRLLASSSDKNYMNVLWGKLGSEILTQNWEVALDDLTHLREYVEGLNFNSALQALQLRTWIIHWSLFVYFNHSLGSDLIIDHLLYNQNYINTIQTTCPYILRYITAVVIATLQNKTKNVLRDVVRLIQQESYSYRDPITEFVECLCINYDFDGAQKKLVECGDVLKSDFFLVSFESIFLENARLLIFETFCRVHECISISMLADKLNMEEEEAEKWIVNLICNVHMDAKIDSQLGHVKMGNMAVSPYQQLIEKTKSLAYRIQVMASNLESKSGGSGGGGERVSSPAELNF